MGNLSISCPGCQRQLVFPDSSVVGKTARCPSCSHRFVIEPPAEEPAPVIRVQEPAVLARSRGKPRTGSRPAKRERKPAWIPLAITVGLGLLAVTLLVVLGGGDGPADGGGEARPVADAAAENPGGPGGDVTAGGPALPEADVATGAIRVETNPAGALVLVDDQQVIDEEGNPQRTPCVVTAPKGSHAVTVVRPGFVDQVRQVTVSAKEVDVMFGVPREGVSALMKARWFASPHTGEPVPIAAVNSVGRARDPWLSRDGLSLWFIASGSDGQGVYFATRPNAYEEFGQPQFVPITRGRDLRASPSVTTEGLLVYAVPEKAAIWGAIRGGPLQPFDDKHGLASSSKTTPRWTASQISSSGLHLYWVEETDGRGVTLHASRADLESDFGPAATIALPGIRPSLSADGLRQYTFDGKVLLRWRRSSLRGLFNRDETVAELDLPEYTDDRLSRQFAVSDDERWLVYRRGPEDGDPLMMVRLHEHPFRGARVVGVPAPPRQVVARGDKKTTAKPARTPAEKLKIDPKSLVGTDKKTTKNTKPVKPRRVPDLALTTHMRRLEALLANRDYEAAKTYLAEAASDKALSQWAELLTWDREELQLIEAFWVDARRVASEMKPDDPVRIGSVRLKFVRFEDGVLVAKGQAKPIERPLVKMAASDLVAMVEGTLKPADTEPRLRLGVFLHHDLKGRGTSAARRLARAGDSGKQFVDRRGLRLLEEAKAEIGRDRPERALPLLEKIETSYAGSTASDGVSQARQSLYSLEKWTKRGGRAWERKGSAVRATPGRAAGSLLVSPKDMPAFVLTLEWKTEGETGQGGVFFRYGGSGDPNSEAVKVQLSSDAGVAADQFSTGALFGVAPPASNAVKPTGEWNSLKLTVDGEQVEVVINGRSVLKTNVSDPDLPASGHVALDGVAGGITYRQVLLVPLAGR